MMSYNDSDYFHELYQSRWSKWASVAFSISATSASLIFIYSIIWFEHFGSDERRTLPNKFVSSAWWCGFFFLGVSQVIDIFRYLFGPMPGLLCRFSYFNKLTMTTQAMLFLDINMISRYIFIFWLKNPAGFDHEFWSCLINTWIVLFSWIAQFVSYIMLGKENQQHFLCTGQNPALYSELRVVQDSFSLNNVVRVLTLLINVVIFARISVYKSKQLHFTPHPRSKLSFTLNSENKMLADATTNIVSAICFLLIGVSQFQINIVDFDILKQYPYFLLEYFYRMIRVPLTCLLLIIVMYVRNKDLRKTVVREFSNSFL